MRPVVNTNTTAYGDRVTRVTPAPLVVEGTSPAPGRLTPRGRRVLAVLAGCDTPLTAHQIYGELRAAGVRIGRTTVYRALHLLVDAGRVHEFRSHSDEAGYRACSADPHDHLVCTRCGRVRELHLAGLDDSLAALRDEGFLVAGCRIEVNGLCSRCTSLDATPPATHRRS